MPSGALESKACASPHRSVDALKASMEEEWTNMSEDYVGQGLQGVQAQVGGHDRGRG